jgi:hypothetical protein
MYTGNILELSIKSLKEGTRAPSLAETGDETRNWAQKKYKGVEWGAKTLFWTKTQGQMSLVRSLYPETSLVWELSLFSFSVVRACLYAFEQNTCSLSVSACIRAQG